jgi:predicted  nucleic acid-binding Zn-ribbon protein
VRIRPQMLNEIREKNKLYLCENCGRILYGIVKPEARPERKAE